MATFRNSQIEEILNDERRHNRTIMDRQKQHISAIGDQRAPPTSRDIKMEAILGTLVDELKEEINKVIQLVSAFQFGKLDDKKIDRLFGLDTNNPNKVNSELNTSKEDAGAPPSDKGKQIEEGDEEGDDAGEDDIVVKKDDTPINFVQPVVDLTGMRDDVLSSLEKDINDTIKLNEKVNDLTSINPKKLEKQKKLAIDELESSLKKKKNK
jgi:hypothetical protein